MKSTIEQVNNMPVRDIKTITDEIKNIQKQANALALLYAVEIGRRLEEAKRVLPYGEWGNWLKDEVEFSQSTANNFMRLFEEYGSSQISIFGASIDSQTFANLPYSKALQLLAIPKDEREQFVAEAGVEDMSVRELKAAIEERDKARKEAELAKAHEQEIAEKLDAAEEAAEQATKKEAEADELRKKLDDLNGAYELQQDRYKKLQEKLSEAESNPKIPKKKLDEIKKEASEAAKREADENAKNQIDDIMRKYIAANEEAERAKQAELNAKAELEEAKKKLKTANTDVASFKALFDQMQGMAAKLHSMVENIKNTDPDMAAKLNQAIKAFASTL